MSVQFYVTKHYDRDLNVVGGEIQRDEWISYLAQDSELKIKSEPTKGRNPITGEVIVIPPQPDTAYIVDEGAEVPFVGYNDGDLSCYAPIEYDNPNCRFRQKLGQIARDFKGLIMCDVGDEIFDW